MLSHTPSGAGDNLASITVSGASSSVTMGPDRSGHGSGLNTSCSAGPGNSTFYVNDSSTVIQAPSDGGKDTVMSLASDALPTK